MCFFAHHDSHRSSESWESCRTGSFKVAVFSFSFFYLNASLDSNFLPSLPCVFMYNSSDLFDIISFFLLFLGNYEPILGASIFLLAGIMTDQLYFKLPVHQSGLNSTEPWTKLSLTFFSIFDVASCRRLFLFFIFCTWGESLTQSIFIVFSGWFFLPIMYVSQYWKAWERKTSSFTHIPFLLTPILLLLLLFLRAYI